MAYGHSTRKLRRDFGAYVPAGRDDFEGNCTEKIQGLGMFRQKKEGKGDAAPVRVAEVVWPRGGSSLRVTEGWRRRTRLNASPVR